MDDDTPAMGDVLKIVNRELHARHQSWADLARALGLSDQVVSNWKRRGKVPPGRYLDIAGFLGWNVEQLTGHAPEPPRQTRPVIPEPVYTKRANDIARAFDELKDQTVRQQAYATVMGLLQMAKAGQRVPESPEPPPPAVTPTPTSRQPERAPKKTPPRAR